MKIFIHNKRSIFSAVIQNIYTLYKKELLQYDNKHDYIDHDLKDPLTTDLLSRIVNNLKRKS